MKKFFKYFFIFLLVAFIAIQFFRPTKNISLAASQNDIIAKYAVPQDVQSILKASCYDCHSNNTAYPWYNNIQPVAWFLADHVKEGKKELNFSEFATYRVSRQYRKFEEIGNEVKEGEMPLSSYTIIHGNAKLNEEQRATIIRWVISTRDSMQKQHPADSLVRPKKQA
jgi:Haem-binding domain